MPTNAISPMTASITSPMPLQATITREDDDSEIDWRELVHHEPLKYRTTDPDALNLDDAVLLFRSGLLLVRDGDIEAGLPLIAGAFLLDARAIKFLPFLPDRCHEEARYAFLDKDLLQELIDHEGGSTIASEVMMIFSAVRRGDMKTQTGLTRIARALSVSERLMKTIRADPSIESPSDGILGGYLNRTTLHGMRSSLFELMGNKKKAIQELSSALKIDPSLSSIRFKRACLYASLDGRDCDVAAKEFRHAITDCHSDSSDLPVAYAWLAKIYLERDKPGAYNLAKAYWRKSREAATRYAELYCEHSQSTIEDEMYEVFGIVETFDVGVDSLQHGDMDSARGDHDHSCLVCGCRSNNERAMLQCSRCKQTFYCSEQCQQEDWPEHDKICRHVFEEELDNESSVSWKVFSHSESSISSCRGVDNVDRKGFSNRRELLPHEHPRRIETRAAPVVMKLGGRLPSIQWRKPLNDRRDLQFRRNQYDETSEEGVSLEASVGYDRVKSSMLVNESFVDSFAAEESRDMDESLDAFETYPSGYSVGEMREPALKTNLDTRRSIPRNDDRNRRDDLRGRASFQQERRVAPLSREPHIEHHPSLKRQIHVLKDHEGQELANKTIREYLIRRFEECGSDFSRWWYQLSTMQRKDILNVITQCTIPIMAAPLGQVSSLLLSGGARYGARVLTDFSLTTILGPCSCNDVECIQHGYRDQLLHDFHYYIMFWGVAENEEYRFCAQMVQEGVFPDRNTDGRIKFFKPPKDDDPLQVHKALVMKENASRRAIEAVWTKVDAGVLKEHLPYSYLLLRDSYRLAIYALMVELYDELEDGVQPEMSLARLQGCEYCRHACLASTAIQCPTCMVKWWCGANCRHSSPHGYCCPIGKPTKIRVQFS